MNLCRIKSQDDLETKVFEIDEREKAKLRSQLEVRRKIREEKEARRRRAFWR